MGNISSKSSSTLENGILRIRFALTLVPKDSTKNIKFDRQNGPHITLVSVFTDNPDENFPTFCQNIVDEIGKSLTLVTDLEDNKDYIVNNKHEQIPVEISWKDVWTSKTLLMASLELDDQTVRIMNELSVKIVEMFEQSHYNMLGEDRSNPNYSWVYEYPKDVQEKKFSWLEKIGDANFLSPNKHVTINYNIDPTKTLQENCQELGINPDTKYVVAIDGVCVSKTDILGRLLLEYLYKFLFE